MARYQITTLIDITRTNPSRNETNKLKLGQQSNFNSVLQTIGLRSNVDWEVDPVRESGRLSELDTKIAHWIWEFTAERDQIFYKSNTDPVGLLLDDLNSVPIVIDLTEEADINPAAIVTRGDSPNTWVREL